MGMSTEWKTTIAKSEPCNFRAIVDRLQKIN